MKRTTVLIVLTILSIYSFSVGYTSIFAQEKIQCPEGQIPVYQNGVPVPDPVTGKPQCSPITGLDPLGNIFGR